MADFAQQINQIRQSNQASMANMFSNIDQGISNLQELQTKKLQVVGNKLEMINSIADELGKITGEYVKDEKDELLKEIKSSILKEKKIGKFSIGQSVDLSKLNSFNDRVTRLGRLAENSRVIDQVYKAAEERVSVDPLINDVDRGRVRNQILKTLSDKEAVETLSIEDLASNIDSVIKRNSDDVKVVKTLIGEVGRKKMSYIDSNGASRSFDLPDILELNQKGQPVFSEQGMARVSQAIEKGIAGGYDIDPATAASRYYNTLSTGVKIEEADALTRAIKGEQLKKLRAGSGDDEFSANQFIRLIQDPRAFQDGGYGVTSRRALSELKQTLGLNKLEYASPEEVKKLKEESGGLRSRDENYIFPDSVKGNTTYILKDDGRKIEFIDLNNPQEFNTIKGLLNKVPQERRGEILQSNWINILKQDLKEYADTVPQKGGDPTFGPQAFADRLLKGAQNEEQEPKKTESGKKKSIPGF